MAMRPANRSRQAVDAHFALEKQETNFEANSLILLSNSSKDRKYEHTKVAANFRIYSLEFTYLASDELAPAPLGKHRVPLAGKSKTFRK